MNIPTISHTQWGEDFVLYPSFARYGNGRLAFQLYSEDGESFATISVNLPSDQLYTDADFFVKEYAENEEVVKTLIKQGWLVRTPRTVRSGFVTIPVMNLSGKLLEWYDSLSPEEVL